MKRSTSFQFTQEGAISSENISEKSRENEVLQKYVLLKQNKELSFVLDCKTRWSSIYEMVERFVCLKKCISKALLNLSIEHGISTTEFLFLNDLKCTLEPIKLAVEALCRKDPTLLTAEGVFQSIFEELEKRKSTLAEDLLCAVKNRVHATRVAESESEVLGRSRSRIKYSDSDS